MFKLPNLPYSLSSLEPFLSAETLEFHYGKHHKSYIDKLNYLIQDTEFEKMSLEEIILSSKDSILSCASQAWNHTFYWKCMMAADEKSEPSTELAHEIQKFFGSKKKLKVEILAAANNLVGSGWIWLVIDSKKNMRVVSLRDADSPLLHDFIPLLVCDVWEHAYYIDYRNSRERYVEGFLEAIDWSFVGDNLKARRVQNLSHDMTLSFPQSPKRSDQSESSSRPSL